MAEQKIFFDASDLKIEALFDEQPGERAVVLSGPHPLYGGNMLDPVVDALRRVYARNGYATLRFNYRGVGASEGMVDDGIGPQDDVRAALDCLAARGKRRLELAGYSFGAWVDFRVVQSCAAIERAVLVSPPVDTATLSFAGASGKIALVVCGDEDHFASVDSLRRLVPQWNPAARLEFIPDANHYVMLKTDELSAIVDRFLSGAEMIATANR